MCWYLCIENAFDWHLDLSDFLYLKIYTFFICIYLFSGYQILKRTWPKGYQGFRICASPEYALLRLDNFKGNFLNI